MHVTWRTEWPHWVLLAFLAIVLAFSPARQVPIHWNAAGAIDGYAEKWIAGVIALGLYLLMLLLPRIDPNRANYAQFATAYGVVRLAILALLVILMGSVALGLHVLVDGLVEVVMGAFLFVVGTVMGKVRPNWFVGIRTPWTLSSKRSWVKTHRLGGWLFVAWGLLEIVAGLALPSWRPQVLIGSAVVVVGALVVYSYLVWRGDPEKEPALAARPAP